MTRRRKKAVFVTGSLERGGAQRVLSQLCNHCSSKDWQVVVVPLLKDEAGYPLHPDVRIRSICRDGSYGRNICYWIRGLRQIFQSEAPDLVVSFAGRINLLTYMAMLGSHIPLLISERNDPAHDRRRPWERILCRFCYGRVDQVVFQTSYQREYYGDRCQKNSRIIVNPISAPLYEGVHPSEDILSVGKLMPQKNHSMLILAFAEISKKYPNMKVHICGEGSQRDQLQEQIDSLGLTDRILLEGNCESIFEKMQTCRYFIMTSNYEGMSNALAEAMTSGMDCISTAWNGVEELMTDGETGYLVPVGDVMLLAGKMDELFSGRIPGCGANARRKAKAWQADPVLDQWFMAMEDTVREGK